MQHKVCVAWAVVAVVAAILLTRAYIKKYPKAGFVDWTGPYSGMEWPAYPTYPPGLNLKNAYMN